MLLDSSLFQFLLFESLAGNTLPSKQRTSSQEDDINSFDYCIRMEPKIVERSYLFSIWRRFRRGMLMGGRDLELGASVNVPKIEIFS